MKLGLFEILAGTWIVGLTTYAGGYCIWSGLNLKRTQNFSGYKFQDCLNPDRLEPAAKYFGNLMIAIGLAFLAIPLIFIMPFPRAYYLFVVGAIYLWGVALYIGKRRYCQRSK